jgi:hypothetical protein
VAVPQPKKKMQALAVEREILEEWIPTDTCRPDYMAVRSAFIERFTRFYLLLHDELSNRSGKKTFGSPEEVATAATELQRLDKECTRMARQLFNRSNPWAVRDWRKPRIVKFLLRTIRRSPGPGRPETPQTDLAMLVALRDQGLNDAQIADRLGLTKDSVRKRFKAAEKRRT